MELSRKAKAEKRVDFYGQSLLACLRILSPFKWRTEKFCLTPPRGLGSSLEERPRKRSSIQTYRRTSSREGAQAAATQAMAS